MIFGVRLALWEFATAYTDNKAMGINLVFFMIVKGYLYSTKVDIFHRKTILFHIQNNIVLCIILFRT